jgi:hypothetical protein
MNIQFELILAFSLNYYRKLNIEYFSRQCGILMTLGDLICAGISLARIMCAFEWKLILRLFSHVLSFGGKSVGEIYKRAMRK